MDNSSCGSLLKTSQKILITVQRTIPLKFPKIWYKSSYKKRLFTAKDKLKNEEN